MEKNKLQRRNAITVGEAMMMMFKAYRMSAGHNTQRIFQAWDAASGAAPFTIRRFFRDGKLYITVNSSVARNQLLFQRQALVDKINALLESDEMFIKDDPRVSYVKELIIK